MYELRCLGSVSERCLKKAAFLVFLWLTSSADASSANKLEGEVLLSQITTSSYCRHICPRPYLRQTSANQSIEKQIIDRCWEENFQYRFVHKEMIFGNNERPFRELVGSQTACHKHANDSYTCDLRSEEFCPSYVALAFNVREPSNISIGVSQGNPDELVLSEKHLSGKQTKKAYMIGTNIQQPKVRFNLTCHNTECLDDSITVISIQYRCTRDIQALC